MLKERSPQSDAANRRRFEEARPARDRQQRSDRRSHHRTKHNRDGQICGTHSVLKSCRRRGG